MLVSFLVLLLVVEVVLPMALFALRNRLIFFPSPEPPERGLAGLEGRVAVRLVRIRRPDGRLLAAYDAQPLAMDGAAGPVVLFCHGNAGNIAWRASLLARMVQASGARTLLFDYSGFGGNDGEPAEAEVYQDGLAAYDHLVREGVDARRIVLYGESLGVAVALHIAEQRPVAGVVAQSGFSSLSSLARGIYPWLPLSGWLVRDLFPNQRRLAALSVPVLIVHGTADEIIPFAEAGRLRQAYPGGAELMPIEGAGHNDLFEVAGEEYLTQLGVRFRSWVGQTAHPADQRRRAPR